MDLTGLPPVRRRTSGVLSIDTNRLRSPWGQEGVRPTDARNPDDRALAGHHRPLLAPPARDAGFLKASYHEPTATSGEGSHPVTGRPASHVQRIGGEPGDK